MVSLKSILALATLAVAALAAPAPTPDVTLVPIPNKPSTLFNGTGHIRTRNWQGDYEDLGCLTKEGRWTIDDKLCGVFKAKRFRPDRGSIDLWRLSSKAGPCRIYGAEFICESGFEGYDFGAWPWPNAIPGVECLRWGLGGVMAGNENNPPREDDAPEKIHLVSFYEPGKYVWLTWSPL